MKPDDLDSVGEYIDYLHTQIRLDEQKLNSLKDEEHAGYMAIGAAIYIKAIEEKYGMELPSEFWLTAAMLKLSPEEVKAYIDNFKANDIEMQDMCDYLQGNPMSDGKSASEVSSTMASAIKESNPELSEDDVYDRLQSMVIGEA
jgi:hypothetical protein